MDLTVPSGSVAENVTVTRVPVVEVAGLTLVIVTVGGWSLIVMELVPEPVEPALSVAVTVIVKVLLARVRGP